MLIIFNKDIEHSNKKVIAITRLAFARQFFNFVLLKGFDSIKWKAKG